MIRRSLLVVSLALLAACAPTLRVQVLEPAPVNFGAAKRLSVVQTEGRRSAREVVVEHILNQARSMGYFAAKDRSEEGITIRAAGRTAQLAGAPPASDEIYVRVDVLEWGADRETKSVTEKDSNGKEYTRRVTVISGKALLAITAVTPSGKALLAETEFQGGSEGDTETRALESAASNAVSQFLWQITPKTAYRSVRLDDEDKAQQPIIKVAAGGNVAMATTDMREYVKANPTNPSAQYNLAVLLDASGQYDEALDLYAKAIKGSTKDYYATARAECARRLANQQALSQ
jgi:tetratricopeptide (TPR) repeat protein